MERWKQDLNNVTLSSSLDQRRPDRPDAVHAQFTPSRIDRETGRRTRTMHLCQKLALSEALNRAKKCLAF